RNGFLLALDRRGEWYRQHHLLRESLGQDLADQEPELVPGLHQRAADWLEENGDPAAALQHAYAGGNGDPFLRIFRTTALWEYARGRDSDIREWLAHLDDGSPLATDPSAAAAAAKLHAHAGNLAEARRCLDAGASGLAWSTSGDESGPDEAKIAAVRAAL